MTSARLVVTPISAKAQTKSATSLLLRSATRRTSLRSAWPRRRRRSRVSAQARIEFSLFPSRGPPAPAAFAEESEAGVGGVARHDARDEHGGVGRGGEGARGVRHELGDFRWWLV